MFTSWGSMTKRIGSGSTPKCHGSATLWSTPLIHWPAFWPVKGRRCWAGDHPCTIGWWRAGRCPVACRAAACHSPHCPEIVTILRIRNRNFWPDPDPVRNRNKRFGFRIQILIRNRIRNKSVKRSFIFRLKKGSFMRLFKFHIFT